MHTVVVGAELAIGVFSVFCISALLTESDLRDDKQATEAAAAARSARP